MSARRRDALLSRASAYWRLARKAERAGDLRAANRYRDIADRAYRAYLLLAGQIPRDQPKRGS